MYRSLSYNHMLSMMHITNQHNNIITFGSFIICVLTKDNKKWEFCCNSWSRSHLGEEYHRSLDPLLSCRLTATCPLCILQTKTITLLTCGLKKKKWEFCYISWSISDDKPQTPELIGSQHTTSLYFLTSYIEQPEEQRINNLRISTWRDKCCSLSAERIVQYNAC